MHIFHQHPDDLRASGPVVEADLVLADGTRRKVQTTIDLGCPLSGISAEMVDRLGLEPVREQIKQADFDPRVIGVFRLTLEMGKYRIKGEFVIFDMVDETVDITLGRNILKDAKMTINFRTGETRLDLPVGPS